MGATFDWLVSNDSNQSRLTVRISFFKRDQRARAHNACLDNGLYGARSLKMPFNQAIEHTLQKNAAFTRVLRANKPASFNR